VHLSALFRRKPPFIGTRSPGAIDALSSFTRWLARNPIDGDGLYGHLGVRYQVARYCEYLEANPWPSGDPLRDAQQRQPVVDAYAAYLGTFDTPAQTISLVRNSLDHFYLFLGTGAAASR